MAYYIYDSRGMIDAGPSIGGFRDLKNQIADKIKTIAKYPQTHMLFYQGYATKPIMLRSELNALAKLVDMDTVKESLQKMSEAAKKCDSIFILRTSPDGN